MFNKSCVLISYNDLPEFNLARGSALKCDYIIVCKNAISLRWNFISFLRLCVFFSALAVEMQIAVSPKKKTT